MAKVKIQGHASGTGILTVTAPNTSTDRTITLPDSTGTLATTADTFDPDGAVVINESGADVDFRVESDTHTHAIFVEGSNGKINLGGGGAGSPTPSHDVIIHTDNDGLMINNYGQTNGEFAKIMFASHDTAAPNTKGAIVFKRAGDFGVGDMQFWVDSNADDATAVEADAKLILTQDGRGLSQFTALAWCDYTGTGINDTFNVSSVSEAGTAQYTFNFSNNMANDTYTVVASTCKGGGGPSASNSAAVSVGETRAVGSCLIEAFRGDAVTRQDGDVRMVIFGDV